jgi:hypothetical protein
MDKHALSFSNAAGAAVCAALIVSFFAGCARVQSYEMKGVYVPAVYVQTLEKTYSHIQASAVVKKIPNAVVVLTDSVQEIVNFNEMNEKEIDVVKDGVVYFVDESASPVKSSKNSLVYGDGTEYIKISDDYENVESALASWVSRTVFGERTFKAADGTRMYRYADGTIAVGAEIYSYSISVLMVRTDCDTLRAEKAEPRADGLSSSLFIKRNGNKIETFRGRAPEKDADPEDYFESELVLEKTAQFVSE